MAKSLIDMSVPFGRFSEGKVEENWHIRKREGWKNAMLFQPSLRTLTPDPANGCSSGWVASQDVYRLMHTQVILEGLRKPEAPIRPGHIERRTDEVVIRIIAEVRDND
jgi:hypothetical protein